MKKESVAISLKALDGLKFDAVRFQVKPGSKVELTLKNVSDMSHNLLITQPGARIDVVNAALKLAEKGPQMDFIPVTDSVLWSIPVLSPGESKSITFTAPTRTGVYPFVCTYPGHGFIMYGAMYVTNDTTLPDIRNDLNIPEFRRQEDAAGSHDSAHHHSNEPSPHPYALVPPYLYHVFLEDASPDAIAVRLPKDLSYCWDASECRLRFAWNGGFLDMNALWQGHMDTSARILGNIFFRDNTVYPLRSGQYTEQQKRKYKGYRLVDGYPEFHYTVDGIDVYELIRQTPGGDGLIRNFRIPNADRRFSFYTNQQDDALEYTSSTGRFANRKLELSADAAKAFTITMTSYHLAYKNSQQ